jgi:hypothetical protein
MHQHKHNNIKKCHLIPMFEIANEIHTNIIAFNE